ncbi:3-hydroxyacyl-CoA dehydrogenase NAD-binding domain-containing protein [Pseudovibrio sp. Tun.PSC04-5.I4]|uniref:3-hydroxyacyl-CoA dehydrogenase NAD-binding domain-containing protein n=1 Tax=Pseudovibrio sp. Tun.PSC04-5.I4 TaxID=1798213 RepID=UPI00088DE86D|nr:3-hydroxyacyl-CoA dehydrogenase NAD-binding domain-containing protein [Pseudovibrio sp. Tun.PSC04-5.I4]SDQ21869.1 3-hydroxyacyl-CoA dehydrogenase [Pseudovibrio sp. Tun.PSC04-5.I4]
MSEYKYEKDVDGIVTITFDSQGKSANTMTRAWSEGMKELVAKLSTEEDLTGIVIASAKKTFFAGGDLEEMLHGSMDPQDIFAYVEEMKAPLRALEKLPVPVVAAINGAALGGGFEICLACNHRILLNTPKAVVGLPEATLGLLPGAGGVIRLTAKLGLETALPLLVEGKQLKPAAALKVGLVEALVETQEELIPAAKAWIKANPEAVVQSWDQKGFRYPGGGADSAKVRMVAAMAPTMLVNKTRGLMPAPEKVIDIAVNSMRMGFDSALRTESRGFTALLRSTEARAAISTFFFGMQAIKSGKVRPQGEAWKASSSAILGAGMMGSGIAWAHASRGLPTVLKDMSLENAEKGKGYSEKLVDKAITRGRMDDAKKAALLGCITATDSDETFAGTDIIIEAVFEDISLKEKVIPETYKQLSDTGIYGSNTSTLPISILAESCPDPTRFIGLHFFSPVDKMEVVEIIVGEMTSNETLRKAYDYVQQIGYLPIVVNDKRGFFTSRVFGTYLDEGLALMRDGMSPVAIERAAWKIGMPVGPLAVHDEVSMVLTKKIHETHIALDKRLGVENGFPADDSSNVKVGQAMVGLNRGGRHYGGGFYEYAADGTKKLWDGLTQFKERDLNVSMQDAEDRMMYRQAIETLRCLDEDVLRTEVEANIGSIFAIGFPAHTGGALQFIHGVGLEAFKTRADELAAAYGPRFKVTEAALNKLRSEKLAAA